MINNRHLLSFSVSILFSFFSYGQIDLGVDTVQFNKLKTEWIDEFYSKAAEKIKKDTTLLLDRFGNYSSAKFMYYLSGMLLNEQLDLYDDFAKTTLNNKEYNHFKKLKIKIDESSRIPVLTFDKTIEFDKEWILSFYAQSILVNNLNLNNYEYLYYLNSSKIDNDVAPSYLSDLFEYRNFSMYIANSLNQAFLNWFVLMHEFYHSFYDKGTDNRVTRELKADSFAVEKCLSFFNSKESISDKDFFAGVERIYGKDKFLSLMENSRICKTFPKVIGDNVSVGEFYVSLLGKTFIDVFNYKDINYILTNPEIIELDLARTNQFNLIAENLLKCEFDSANTFCCIVLNDISQSMEFENLRAGFKPPEYYRNLKVDIELFKQLSPQNPSFISYQLGCYYLNLKDYDNAIKYFSSANLVEEPSITSILCNLLCSDIYKNIEPFKDMIKAKFHYKIAKEQNKLLPILNDKILIRPELN